MPNKHRKKTPHSKARRHGQARHKAKPAHHADFIAAAKAHHRKRNHSRAHALPTELKRAVDRPVTVKTLRDIVALRRVHRGL